MDYRPLPAPAAAAGYIRRLSELKDLLWTALNSESNKITAITQQESIVHRNKDLAAFHQELLDEGEDEEIEILDDDFIEDADELEDWTPQSPLGEDNGQ